MRNKSILGVAVVFLALVSGCPTIFPPADNDNANDNAPANTNDNDNDNTGGGTEREFNPFVRELFAATSDSADPVEVNELTFTFDEDPEAFNDLIEDALNDDS